MKFLGILRASGLCLLAIGFHSQFVSCGIFKGPKKPKEDSNVKAAEISEDSTVKYPVADKPSQEPSSASSAPAPKSNLVFENSKWDDSMLASSVLFLEEFCRGIQGDTFKGNISDANIMELSWACLSVSSYTKFLSERATVIYGPGSVAERKRIDQNFYEGKLRPEELEVCVEWLKKNIRSTIESLNNMYNESIALSEQEIKNSRLAGPIKYGFVFKSDGWRGFVDNYLNDVTMGFTLALELLHRRIDEIQEISTNRYNAGMPKDTSNVNVSGVSDDLEEYAMDSSTQIVEESDLVFNNSTWDDSQLASAIYFMKEFCRDVISKKFKGKLSDDSSKDLSRVCVYVSSYLEPFSRNFLLTYTPGPEGVRKKVKPAIYKGVLNPEEFDVYVDWLVMNIPGIKMSYINMGKESLDMATENLKAESKTVLSKYGFSPKNASNSKLLCRFISPKYLAADLFVSMELLQHCLRGNSSEAINKMKEELEKLRKDKQEELIKII
ncbi:secreted antigen 1 [Babesia divergens]|uniref:Secreted antigen 1 n=1 Tax=Babesia divergens TaxID=32595 RepID=A0AAD9G788_BABDI|nr:secreted antigen 1 [Babesia divergens]